MGVRGDDAEGLPPSRVCSAVDPYLPRPRGRPGSGPGGGSSPAYPPAAGHLHQPPGCGCPGDARRRMNRGSARTRGREQWGAVAELGGDPRGGTRRVGSADGLGFPCRFPRSPVPRPLRGEPDPPVLRRRAHGTTAGCGRPFDSSPRGLDGRVRRSPHAPGGWRRWSGARVPVPPTPCTPTGHRSASAARSYRIDPDGPLPSGPARRLGGQRGAGQEVVQRAGLFPGGSRTALSRSSRPGAGSRIQGRSLRPRP